MRNRGLTEDGESWEAVEAAMVEAAVDDLEIYEPHNFKPTYYPGPDVRAVVRAAAAVYVEHNALYGNSSYPSLKRFETDVVEASLALLGGAEEAAGTCTMGGTESNFIAVKSARDWARDHLPHARAPEMVVPRSAHPSFDKAAHLLGVTLIRLERTVDWVADLDAMAAAITENTVMLVGSAPPFPYGQTDPIPEIAALAREHGLWLHVDGCLGGFVLPFMRKLGEPLPAFDLSVPGVRSMSADVHKFGYAAKGIAVQLLADRADLDYQTTVFTKWDAGTYITPSFSASRSGGPVASAWAVMRYLGEAGYLRIVGTLNQTKKRLIAGIEAIDGLEVWARPDGHHLTFGSRVFDIFAVEEAMAERGWLCNRVEAPDGIMLFLNMSHPPMVDDYLADLETATAAVRAGKRTARVSGAVYTT